MIKKYLDFNSNPKLDKSDKMDKYRLYKYEYLYRTYNIDAEQANKMVKKIENILGPRQIGDIHPRQIRQHIDIEPRYSMEITNKEQIYYANKKVNSVYNLIRNEMDEMVSVYSNIKKHITNLRKIQYYLTPLEDMYNEKSVSYTSNITHRSITYDIYVYLGEEYYKAKDEFNKIDKIIEKMSKSLSADKTSAYTGISNHYHAYLRINTKKDS